MIEIKVANRCPDFKSYRAARVKSMFNVDHACNFDLTALLPADDDTWQIGVIVGPSGSGKSSIGRNFWPGIPIANLALDWPTDQPIIDVISPDKSFDQVTAAFVAVGLGSVPSWLRPFHVLSIGEQFRAGVARIIADRPERVIIDEFTSALDRRVALNGARSFARAWRRDHGQCLILTCHRDILRSLQPDWIYDTATGEFSGRYLQCPKRIKVDVYKTNWSYWPLFEQHHYLRLHNMVAAKAYVGFVDGVPVCHAGVTTHLCGVKSLEARIARVVVMPEWQGLGIGHRFLNAIAAWNLQGSAEGRLPGRRLPSLLNTSHPGLARTLRGDPAWIQVSGTLHGSNRSRKLSNTSKPIGRGAEYGGHFRATQGFRYIGG